MNMNAPLISVVVPIHNGAIFAEETLESIFGQTIRDFELILVDDASTDDLKRVLERFRDSRLRVVRLERNVGVANARNEGVSLARGKYIAFCDADDICHLERLERQLAYFQQNPNLGICGTSFTCFSGTQELETVRHATSDSEIRAVLLMGNCFGMSTIMGKTEIFKAHAFDQAMSPTEDYDLWTRLANAGVQMANLRESLLRYRVHPTQASQRKSALLDRLSRKIRALYCARLVDAGELVKRICGEVVTEADLDAAAAAISNYCRHHAGYVPHQFRFLLAWLYQKQPCHGFRTWWRWRKIQTRLGLDLDQNYRFNIALFALLPSHIANRYADVLLKLKR